MDNAAIHEVIYDFQFITNKFQVVDPDINAVDDNGNTPLHYA